MVVVPVAYFETGTQYYHQYAQAELMCERFLD